MRSGMLHRACCPYLSPDLRPIFFQSGTFPFRNGAPVTSPPAAFTLAALWAKQERRNSLPSENPSCVNEWTDYGGSRG
jgi:hypothetical protein